VASIDAISMFIFSINILIAGGLKLISNDLIAGGLLPPERDCQSRLLIKNHISWAADALVCPSNDLHSVLDTIMGVTVCCDPITSKICGHSKL
jgi:hypothetical protein